MNNLPNIIGHVAAFCTTVSFVPQVVKLVKTGEAEGISLIMYLIFTFGVLCWLTYGIILEQWPIIIANSVTIFFCIAIIYIKIKSEIKKNK
ncbi:MAG: SemiSWEET transporter [Candidatus Omnitrophica bacterium]|nr:SemiSWEET transporter [Candidatus Omnitrophota bacterium]